MSAATSGFESTAFTSGSIESLPSRLWDALCSMAKSYTISTSQPTTTTPGTSQSSAAMPTTVDIIESVIGRASCGACNDHATPQTRKRAILIARADGKEAKAPTPTHSRYYSREPQRLDEGVLPWVSMAEALGWGMTERPMITAGNAVGRAEGVGGSGGKAAIEREKSRGAWRFAGAGAAAERTSSQIPRADDEPAHTITGKSTHVWVGNQKPDMKGSRENAYQERSGELPAPTVASGSRSAKIMRSNYGSGGDPAARGERAGDEPAPTVTSKVDRNQWVHGERGEPINLDPSKPATTVAGDPRLTSREHHYHGEQNATSTRVTIEEAAILQSYPADFRWDVEVADPKTGRMKPITKTNTFLQIGNAVPCKLAEAILREVLS